MIAKTITDIKPNGNPWGDDPNSLNYPFKITFDDGMVGVANAKSNPPLYKVGDVVGVEVTGQDQKRNNKLKIDRKWPEKNQAGGGSAFKPQNPVKPQETTSNAASGGHATSSIHPATAGCAFKAAVDVLGDRASDPKAVHGLASSYVRVLQALEAGKLAQPKVVQQAVEQAAQHGFTQREETHEDLDRDVPF